MLFHPHTLQVPATSGDLLSPLGGLIQGPCHGLISVKPKVSPTSVVLASPSELSHHPIFSDGVIIGYTATVVTWPLARKALPMPQSALPPERFGGNDTGTSKVRHAGDARNGAPHVRAATGTFMDLIRNELVRVR